MSVIVTVMSTLSSPYFGFPGQCFLVYDCGGGGSGRGGGHVIVTALTRASVHVVKYIILPVTAVERIVVQATLFNQSLLIGAAEAKRERSREAGTKRVRKQAYVSKDASISPSVTSIIQTNPSP